MEACNLNAGNAMVVICAVRPLRWDSSRMGSCTKMTTLELAFLEVFHVFLLTLVLVLQDTCTPIAKRSQHLNCLFPVFWKKTTRSSLQGLVNSCHTQTSRVLCRCHPWSKYTTSSSYNAVAGRMEELEQRDSNVSSSSCADPTRWTAEPDPEILNKIAARIAIKTSFPVSDVTAFVTH